MTYTYVSRSSWIRAFKTMDDRSNGMDVAGGYKKSRPGAAIRVFWGGEGRTA
jgi:hypothetical protein